MITDVKPPWPWATISDCPGGRSVHRHRTLADARAALRLINRLGCCGRCRGARRHRLVRRQR